jgi:tRNA-uridine 2-sulfurtransferase
LKDKGLLLISGLDSIIAGAVLKEQGAAFETLYFHIPFCHCHPEDDCKLKKLLEATSRGLLEHKLNVVEIGSEYLKLLKNPKHGFGKNMNPCIDCKIFMFKKAKELFQQYGVSYIVTGEVLGERPMSQNSSTLFQIEKEAGLSQLVLRPLSAKLLPLTLAERRGWVDRKGLFDIQGRSRKRQFELVEKYDIKDYPAPSGGCLLTDPRFSHRLRDLIKRGRAFSLDDIYLLKVGRHFRLSKELKLIVGRDEKENNILLSSSKRLSIPYFMPLDRKGPLALAVGGNMRDNIYSLAAEIVAAHCRRGEAAEIEIEFNDGAVRDIFKTAVKNREDFECLRV